ncbi:MAG TPA: SNF2-related protein, partial [Candidatus Acidoferrum sp.]|nr:SNF2-related protein [Candidatus Acidoferrum sp.]
MLKAGRAISFELKHEAFPFQIETLSVIKDLEYAAIFHEQGLGKTKIAIDLALTWLANNVVDSAMIITKKSLIKNWEEEIARHSYFKAKTLNQDAQTLFYAFNTPWRIYLTHYEACNSRKGRFALFLKTRRVGVICDESQKIKNPESTLAKAMHSLSSGFSRRVIMSGTPIANRPYDIWSQIWFLDQGASLGNDFATFQTELDLPDEAGGNAGRQVFSRALGELFGKIRAFTVRKTKATAG